MKKLSLTKILKYSLLAFTFLTTPIDKLEGTQICDFISSDQEAFVPLVDARTFDELYAHGNFEEAISLGTSLREAASHQLDQDELQGVVPLEWFTERDRIQARRNEITQAKTTATPGVKIVLTLGEKELEKERESLSKTLYPNLYLHNILAKQIATLTFTKELYETQTVQEHITGIPDLTDMSRQERASIGLDLAQILYKASEEITLSKGSVRTLLEERAEEAQTHIPTFLSIKEFENQRELLTDIDQQLSNSETVVQGVFNFLAFRILNIRNIVFSPTSSSVSSHDLESMAETIVRQDKEFITNFHTIVANNFKTVDAGSIFYRVFASERNLSQPEFILLLQDAESLSGISLGTNKYYQNFVKSITGTEIDQTVLPNLTSEMYLHQVLENGTLTDAKSFIQNQMLLIYSGDSIPEAPSLESLKKQRIQAIWTEGDFDQAESIRKEMETISRTFEKTLTAKAQNFLLWEKHLDRVEQIQAVYERAHRDPSLHQIKEDIPIDDIHNILKLRDFVDRVNEIWNLSCRSQAFLVNATREEMEPLIQMAEKILQQRMASTEDPIEYQKALNLYQSVINYQDPEKGVIEFLMIIRDHLINTPDKNEEMQQDLNRRAAELKEIDRLTKDIYNASHPKAFLHEFFVGGEYVKEDQFDDLIDHYIQTGGLLGI